MVVSVEWQSTDVPEYYGGHPRPQVADRGTPSIMDKRVAPDKEGAVDTGQTMPRRRKTLISNRGRQSSLSLFRQVYLGEGKPQAQTLALQVGGWC